MGLKVIYMSFCRLLTDLVIYMSLNRGVLTRLKMSYLSL
jgi:hypothetical protein